jgi:hypothetical protein
MPVLDNPKHEQFAQELAKGKTQVEAYELAGYRANEGNASTLASNPEVQGRVKEIKSVGAEKAAVTVASIIDELEEARGVAKEVSQPASMVTASMGKAKVAGLLVDRTEHTGKDGGPIETAEIAPRDLARAVLGILREAKTEA